MGPLAPTAPTATDGTEGTDPPMASSPHYAAARRTGAPADRCHVTTALVIARRYGRTTSPATVKRFHLAATGLPVRVHPQSVLAPIRVARQNRPLIAWVSVFAGLALHELQIAYRQQVRRHERA